MSYIAYLDLLGTKSFCEEEELYYDKINKFSDTVVSLSSILGKSGKIGIFSDSVYVECSQIEKILEFLTVLRTMLIGDDLFFNAALSSGTLGVESVSKISYEKDDVSPNNRSNNEKKESNIFGVRFTNKEIASIYCKQTNFTGIGIWVDPDIIEKVKSTKYKYVNSIYYYKERQDGKTEFKARSYFDIPIFKEATSSDFFDPKRKQIIIGIISRALFSAHCKSQNYSVNYISILINIIRGCDVSSIQWNQTEHTIENGDTVFNLMFSLLCECNNSLESLIGLDSMVLSFLNQIYCCNSMKPYEKESITKMFLNRFECLKKYMHCLNTVPSEPFTNNNRNIFINSCNNNMAGSFVDKIIKESKKCSLNT